MSWIPELINHVCKWIGAKVLEDIEIHQNFQNNPQPMDEEFCCASLLGYFPAIKLCCHYCQALHSDHLGHVGDLRGGPVPGVHQHRVVWLLPPAWLAPVHLRQPVGGGPGSLVPANDDASISPPTAEDRGKTVRALGAAEATYFLCLITWPTLNCTWGGLTSLGSGLWPKWPSLSRNLNTSTAGHSPRGSVKGSSRSCSRELISL